MNPSAVSQFTGQLALTIGWSIGAIFLILIGVWLFNRLTPLDYRAEIRNGNLAAGFIVAAVTLSITTIVVSVVIS